MAWGRKITQSLMIKHFTYSEGKLFWRERTSTRNVARVGDEAGGPDKKGYRQIGFFKKRHRTHRLIFLFHHGWLPAEIDHIDRDTSNDRIENLRPASRLNNMHNTRYKVSGSSRHKGVYFDKVRQKYRARIRGNGRTECLGFFTDEDAAGRAYNAAAIRIQGSYATLNKIEA